MTVISFTKNKRKHKKTELTNELQSEGHNQTLKLVFWTPYDYFKSFGLQAMFLRKFRDQRCIFVYILLTYKLTQSLKFKPLFTFQ